MPTRYHAPHIPMLLLALLLTACAPHNEMPAQGKPQEKTAPKAASKASAHEAEHAHAKQPASGTSDTSSAAGQRATHEEEEEELQLSAAQLAAAGVSLAKAGPATLHSSLQLPGEIRLDEERTAHLTPRIAGVVARVLVTQGQSVKRGQLLAEIDSPQLSEWRSEALAAQQRLQLARSAHARELALFQDGIAARQDWQEAERQMREAEISLANLRHKLDAIGAGLQGQPLQRYQLRAPIDGVVLEKHLIAGEAVKEDVSVFTLADLRQVWAQFALSARELPLARAGSTVQVRSEADQSQAQGTLRYVGAQLGEQNRSAVARVALANPQQRWKPGLPVQISIGTSTQAVTVAVPLDAVQTLEGKSVVFVRSARGMRAQAVQTGRSDAQQIEIVQGLAAGTEYAASGAFVLKSEAGKHNAGHSH